MVVRSPPSSPQPSWPMSLGEVAVPQLGCERQWTGVGGVGQMVGPSWPVAVGAVQVGGSSSSEFWQIGGARHPGVDGLGQMGGVQSWMRGGLGGVCQRGGPSWPVGVMLDRWV